MRIQWAIYGEVKKGHDLVATSGDAAFAARLTQFTDRPGDPPSGLEWGPVQSGFPLQDRYVFLKTQPDLEAGRAGMVRSHAAFVPIEDLARLNNIETLFELIPSPSERLSATLDALDMPDNIIAEFPSNAKQSGVVELALRLGVVGTHFPLVWVAPEPYLPAVAALWSRLPVSLRRVFAFAFQFAPEVRLPIEPTLITTAPALVNRWPATQLLNVQPREGGTLDKVQSWLAGLPSGSALPEILENFDIELTQFGRLGILATLVDLVERLPTLTFSETKRAVNIVARYGRMTAGAVEARGALFVRMCALVSGASAGDLLGLRNLDATALTDLVPSLQRALHSWIATLPPEDEWTASQLSLLEYAVATPTSWWSTPFCDWLTTQARELAPRSASSVMRLLVSSGLSDFLCDRLPATAEAERVLVEALPKKITASNSEHLLLLAERRRWMRLHARVLLVSSSGRDAVLIHVRIAKDADEGKAELLSELGAGPLVQVASEIGEPALLRFVGRVLAAAEAEFSVMPSSGAHRLAVLREAVSVATSPMGDALSRAVREALSHPGPGGNRAEFGALYLACADYQPALLLEWDQSDRALKELLSAEKERAEAALNRFVQQQVSGGFSFLIATPDAAHGWLDRSGVLATLSRIAVHDCAKRGTNAFRCIRIMEDDDCCKWLIDLFTRTQHQPLRPDDAAEIATLLGDGNFPRAAKIVRETVEHFHRRDVAPIHTSIRYTYQIAKVYERTQTRAPDTMNLPKVIIATALPLEREAVMRHLTAASYDARLFADVAPWPADHPRFEIYVFMTGAGNLSALAAMLRAANHGIAPELAFFVGVAGGVKDSSVGDVVYSTKVYYYEGGKEDSDGIKGRPASEYTAEALVQLAHRVASTPWQPTCDTDERAPKAAPAVIASGELVLSSKDENAANFQLLKSSYNDTQVVDMEAYGFMKAMRDAEVRLAMVVRGISDQIANKTATDNAGSQPLATRNAAAFLFALLEFCDALTVKKVGKKEERKKARKKKGFLSFLTDDPEEEDT